MVHQGPPFQSPPWNRQQGGGPWRLNAFDPTPALNWLFSAPNLHLGAYSWGCKFILLVGLCTICSNTDFKGWGWGHERRGVANSDEQTPQSLGRTKEEPRREGWWLDQRCSVPVPLDMPGSSSSKWTGEPLHPLCTSPDSSPQKKHTQTTEQRHLKRLQWRKLLLLLLIFTNPRISVPGLSGPSLRQFQGASKFSIF